MVTDADAQCENRLWFDAKRCKTFSSCKTCDLLGVRYEKGSIEKQIAKERLRLIELVDAKKAAKLSGDKKEFYRIEGEMRDIVFGVMIMQKALIDDFGLGFKSVIDLIKAKRELKKYKNLLKGLV
jgi:hypothetical protein